MRRKVLPTYQVKQELIGYLYSKPNLQLVERMDEIIAQNRTATGALGFTYKGAFYGTRSRSMPKPLDLPDLKTRMDELLDADRALNTEKAYVDSYITAILNMGTCLRTYLQVFPAAVHDIVRKHITHETLDGFSEEYVERALRYNKQGEQLFKQRILKNMVMD